MISAGQIAGEPWIVHPLGVTQQAGQPGEQPVADELHDDPAVGGGDYVGRPGSLSPVVTADPIGLPTACSANDPAITVSAECNSASARDRRRPSCGVATTP